MRNARRTVVLISLVLVVAAAGVALFTSRSSDKTSSPASVGGSSRSDGPDLGSVNGITLDGFDGGERVELASFAGKPLVVNFWASWCLFCIDEMPDFQSVYEDVSSKVAFLGVNIQDDLSQAKELAKLTGVNYAFASDATGEVFRKLDSRSMPTTIFVNAQGDIVERFAGPLDADQLGDRIRKHFGV